MAVARARIAQAAREGAKALDLSRLDLKTLPPEIGDLTALEQLHLDNNQLVALPPEIGGLAALEWLELNNNQLATLPQEIGGLAALEQLHLNNNQLAALPPEIGRLAALEGLGLDNNQLAALPPEIGGLAALERLYLNSNQLVALPPEIGGLAALEQLHLDNNQLAALPPEIGGLAALEWLYLNNNQLAALPQEIGGLAALEGLGLDDNQLAALPPEIGGLAALEGLDLNNNPLPDSLLQAFDAEGLDGLRAWFRSQASAADPLHEAKLVVTGEGRVGKSWALAALAGRDPRVAVGEANTTWGIDRGAISLPHPDAPDVSLTLNTWDFGGQEVYRVTHQFFFSQEALYLLVWNPRIGVDGCRVEEWLRAIALRTGSALPLGATEPARPRARVIMVATHAQEAGGAYLPDYGRSRLPADLAALIVDEIAIDSRTGHDVEALRAMVARHAVALPGMGEPVARTWLAARDAALAEGEAHPWIDFERFQEICRAHGVDDLASARTLAATLLHRAGRALWFGSAAEQASGLSDKLLADTMVLDAEWLSRAFVQVLQDAETRRAGGMLDHETRLLPIWTEHVRPEWRLYRVEEYPRLMTMMRRFDVALPTRESDGERSLVPQLVPTPRPSLPWASDAEAPRDRRMVRLVCVLDYPAEGLVPRLIAATEPFHVYENGAGLFWQGGIFLRDQSSFNAEALVTVENLEKPRVAITVVGVEPGFLMEQLLRALESVLGFWPGMVRRDYLLCVGAGADGGPCSGDFKRENVLRRRASGKRFDCEDCDATWSAEQLLRGLDSRGGPADATYHSAYLYHRERRPCPDAFLIRPLRGEAFNPRTWAALAKERFEITLISELSGKPIRSAEFTMQQDWVRWLGPVTRIASLAVLGVAAPLAGEMADELKDGAEAMKQLGELPSEDFGDERPIRNSLGHGEQAQLDQSQLAAMHELLKTIGLDPRRCGMELAQGRDRSGRLRWMWMSADEAGAHTPPEPKF